MDKTDLEMVAEAKEMARQVIKSAVQMARYMTSDEFTREVIIAAREGLEQEMGTAATVIQFPRAKRERD